MSKSEKLIERMKQNPRDWRIEDLQAVARRYEINWRFVDGSHCTFITKTGKTFPVPARKPIKQVYVKDFLKLLEE